MLRRCRAASSAGCCCPGASAASASAAGSRKTSGASGSATRAWRPKVAISAAGRVTGSTVRPWVAGTTLPSTRVVASG